MTAVWQGNANTAWGAEVYVDYDLARRVPQAGERIGDLDYLPEVLMLLNQGGWILKSGGLRPMLGARRTRTKRYPVWM